MTIEWFRDLVISIFGLVATAFVIMIGVMSFLLYRQIRSIQGSMRSTMATIQSVAGVVSDVLKPFLEITALVEGINRGIKGVTEILHKMKGEESER